MTQLKIAHTMLRRNINKAQLAGFTISNFIGLAIVAICLQGFLDVRTLWTDDDSFIHRDYIVINKKVTSDITAGDNSTIFTKEDIAHIKAQPWVRDVATFDAADYSVTASIGTGNNTIETALFFEAIDDSFIDIDNADWHYTEGDNVVPIILSKDYLTLYNFGFATAAGMPQLSENIIGSIPLSLQLRSSDRRKSINLRGHVVGFSNRLNTILVPKNFIHWSNAIFGGHNTPDPKRLIINVSIPGDTAITTYLDNRGLEAAGDDKNSRATFLLNIGAGITMSIGAFISILSICILMLTISLIMHKNRQKMHRLLTLGYNVADVARPYENIVKICCALSLILSLAALFYVRTLYLEPLRTIGAGNAPAWIVPIVLLCTTIIIITANILIIRRRARKAWRI